MDLTEIVSLCEFDWDEGNKSKVLRRMPLAFAESAFLGEPLLYYDRGHSQKEHRWFLMNLVDRKPVALVFTVRNKKIRIISARFMHRKEVERYGKKIKI